MRSNALRVTVAVKVDLAAVILAITALIELFM